MSTPHFRLRAALLPHPVVRRVQASCSVLVLTSLGLLGALSSPVMAQGAGGTLPRGTLPVLRGPAPAGIAVNTSVAGAATREMTITQQQQRAVLSWDSFNIGRDARVQFIQPSSTASVLNRIYGIDPSIIQGQLSANGQVLLVNQNGILFDRGAQVNVRSLVASTLNIGDERFLAGLTSGGLTSAAFAGGYSDTGVTLDARPDGTRPRNVNVGSFGAADAAAPALQAQAGGSIVILAPRIDVDAGLLAAPDGQVLLAAGKKVFLADNPGAGSAQTPGSGLVVEVEAVADGPALNLTNLIRQAGQISADRGNVTLAALAVNQEGRISSTTAVERSGSIYLQARARDLAGEVTPGSIVFKAGSVTEVVPDMADPATLLEAQRYAEFRGVISAQGRTIENNGRLQVPGGVMNLVAADTAAPENARVYLGAGSETSVAGAWAEVDLSKNLATFTVTSNELKNAPDQKTGVLRGAKVTVDLRESSGILALDGYRDIVPRTVAEKAAVGGELNIGSTGSVIQRSGAVIDASGGGYRYAGGQVNTSRLLGADGRVYDIASAPQGQRYTQLLDSYTRVDDRWGQTVRLDNPLGAVGRYQPGYVEGKAGGVVAIQAAAGLVLDGSLKGGVTIGAQQYRAAPAGAALTLGRSPAEPPTVLGAGELLGSVIWRESASNTLGNDFAAQSVLSSAQRQVSTLAAEQLFGAARFNGAERTESGFGSVTLNAAGSIVVPASVNISSDAGASLVFNAPLIDIAGDIRLPAGRLAMTTTLPDVRSPGDVAAAIERLIVRSGATLSTAGAWINNSGLGGAAVGAPMPSVRLAADGLSSRPTTDGGTISVGLETDQMQTRYERGSMLDVGGGAAIDARGAVTGGRGGLLRLANGAFGQVNPDWLQADMQGFAVANGAQLELSMSRVVVAADGATGLLPADTTALKAGLFADRGFGQITVRSNSSLDVAAGTNLRVQQRNWVIDPETAKGAATGTAIADISSVALLPEHLRNAATLTLSSVGGGGLPGQGQLTLQDGASIVTDARGGATLSAVDGLSVLGRISAPGGAVALTLNGQPLVQADDLIIGSKASISVAGTFLPTPNDQGLVRGSLLNGGTLSITARNAGLQLAAGSRIDVGAVNQTVDSQTSGASPALSTRTLEGHAGTLLIRAQGAVSLQGTLAAQGGAPRAAGGSFALELLRPDGQPTQPQARRVVVTANSNTAPATPGLVDATVNIAALQGAGFDKLRLQSEDRIELRDSMTVDFERGLRLDAPVIDVATGAQVQLRSANVALGQSLGPREAVPTATGVAWTLVPTAALPVAATRSGSGVLSIKAGAVDLFGSLTVNGTALTRIESDSDIRFIGRNIDFASTTGGSALTRQIGGFTSAGNLELKAAQVVPATRSEFTLAVKAQPTDTLVPGGYILVSDNDKAAGAAYSAGSSLTLQADTIVQAGTVKAPLGTLQLQAGSLLELASGSLTSVAGDGLTVLYGNTDSGVRWVYDTSGSTGGLVLDAVTPEGKRITLEGAQVEARPGSAVKLDGGGDVLAIEFIAGNGGDRDITLRDNTFAIIPAARLATMPFDAYTLQLKDPGFGFSRDNGRDGVLYDSITVGAGAAVAAGQYVLLPARFALLPDAYLVQIDTSAAYRNLAAGQTVNLANGDVLVAGFRSARGTTVQESLSVGVRISPGRPTALQASDYDFNGADFFAAAATANRLAAPRSPWDAGRMQIGAGTALSLAGSVNTTPATSAAGRPGRGAEVDVAGTRIAVVASVGAADVAPDFLQVQADSLTALNASVLLGGTRRDTPEGITIATTADEVVVANGNGNGGATEVRLPELLISANQRIEIRAGSALSAVGAATAGPPTVIQAPSSGALVRLSTGAQTRVERGTAAGANGEVTVAAGARLSAAKSLLIDATGSLESAGSFAVGGVNGAGGSLALSSGQVNLGETAFAAAPLSGLVLSNADLARYSAVEELVLRGYSSINFIGNTTLGASGLVSLSLDTPLLQGVRTGAGAEADANVNARAVQLINSSAVSAAASPGSGRLQLQAQTLTLGEGERAVSGFGSVVLAASERLAGAGSGTLQVASALEVQTPQLLALAGSKQTLSAADTAGAARVFRTLAVTGPAAAAATPVNDGTELGGQLQLEGQSLRVSTSIVARSGVIGLNARGSSSSDGVTLAAGALLDAAGQSKDFNGNVALADGGRVTMRAGAGDVSVQSGARVTVAAAASGGAAGHLAIQGKALALEGRLDGSAGPGERSGSIDIDVGSLSNFSALNSAVNLGGFAQERRLRLRSGDINVGSGDDVSATRVSLSADAGRIDVSGRVGAGAAGSGGAQVSLYAATGLTLAAGSELRAQGSGAGARGGEVLVATSAGALVFDSNATIDVRAGNDGPAGAVRFGVNRVTDGALSGVALAGTVKRGGADGGSVASVDVVASRRYAVSGSVNATQIAAFAADHAAFIGANGAATTAAVTGALKDEAGSLLGARVLGAVELISSGNLRLDTAWDLSTASWLADNRPGVLTIRAGGDLTLARSLGLPNDNLLATDSWGLRLTAGADLTAAHPLATMTRAATPQGSLRLTGAEARLRTGTGRIDLVAADNVQIDHVAATIYSAGKVGVADGANNRWAVAGGSISMAAGGNISWVDNNEARDLWVAEWLRRPRLGVAAYDAAGRPADWWVHRPFFRQGVGALAGGNVDVRAGGDVNNLTVALPTTGRTVVTAGVRRVDVQGGGDLRLDAGGNVSGGSFLVGRGVAHVEAAGDIGSNKATQLYLMGVSSGATPDRAQAELVAGGSLALGSIQNPTAMAMVNSAGSGPGFGGQTPSTFFSYSANSGADLQSKSGTASYTASLGTVANWRTFGPAVGSASLDAAAAWPANLRIVAFNGDINNLSASGAPLVTFPSVTAAIALLAGRNLGNLSLAVSDLAPAAAATTVAELNRRALLSGANLVATADLPRIVEREVTGAFVVDAQASQGSINFAVGTGLSFAPSAVSRLQAGVDIVGAPLSLQNLGSNDVSVVRAESGDIRNVQRLSIAGPGQLLLQAGRNIDLGDSTVQAPPGFGGNAGISATGGTENRQLREAKSARVTVVAGVTGRVNLGAMDAVYADIISINSASADILAFYGQLGTEPDARVVLAAANIAELANADPVYARFVALDAKAPVALKAYQEVLQSRTLPLGPTADGAAAATLYTLLNAERDLSRLQAASSLEALASGPGGQAFKDFVALGQRYPLLYSDYVQRRSAGAVPTGVTPIVFSNILNSVVARALPDGASTGNISSFQTSIQTYAGSDIDIWAPGGNAVVGLTTPDSDRVVGVLTNAGGAIRSVLAGNLSINQGKVITLQGGDILLFSSQGSIDAGRGAKTAVTATGETGSGIQTLTSDPDGQGPLTAPKPGNVYLFAPAGTIDAGEAGIRSSGNIVINAQTVLNATNISAGGTSAGVPQVAAGSVASALVSSAGAPIGSKAAEDAAKAAGEAAKKAAAAPPAPKATILSVEVLGFGDKNCKEDDKSCFAK